MATIIVGLIYATIFGFALVRAIRDTKSSKCAGCSGGSCSSRIK